MGTERDVGRLSNQSSSNLPERVGRLETDVTSIQEHIGAIVAVVKYIRDHASDSLEDRVAIAVNDVHQRVSGCIASLNERLDSLRPMASQPEHVTQMPPSTEVGPARSWREPIDSASTTNLS